MSVKASLLSDLPKLKLTDYSLVILYQAAENSSGELQSFITKNKVPVWYIAVAQNWIRQKAIKCRTKARADQCWAGRYAGSDLVQQVPEFSLFTLSDSHLEKLGQLPPLLAPFGNYSSNNAGQVLMKQKIGEVPTPYPLLSIRR